MLANAFADKSEGPDAWCLCVEGWGRWDRTTDGGTRVGKCSAAAWYIEGVVGDRTFPVLMEGTFLCVPVSSFLAETIALESAIQKIRKISRWNSDATGQ